MSYLISVIVPIYNVEKYIERCVRSLLEQTLSQVEFIFVDDCGTDNSMEVLCAILDEYPSKKQQSIIIRHEVNLGLPAARNSGVRVASGDYLLHCDSDDWLDINALSELYSFTGEGSIDLLWCDYYATFETYELYMNQKQPEDNLICLKSLLTEKMHAGVWNKMYKRSLYVDFGILSFEGINMGEDTRLSIELFLCAKSIRYVPSAYYHYVQYNATSLSKVNPEQVFKDISESTVAIIDFLSMNNVVGLEEEINIFKLVSKKKLLSALDIESFKRWRIIFPESNRFIWRYTTLPIHLRLIGWFASIKFWLGIKFYLFLKKLKTR